jgi:hypothetical protein
VSEIYVVRYREEMKGEWTEFVKSSRNGIFLFDRGYMDYHSHRFEDISLMIYESNKLISVLPINVKGNIAYSHAGLTYGGMVYDERMTSNKMLEAMRAVRSYLSGNNIEVLFYKPIPYIFSKIPSQEDLYALTIMGAKLVKRDLSSAICLSSIPKISKGRKYQVNLAKKNNVLVEKSDEYIAYWKVLEKVISKHGVQPVHSVDEIKLLASRFSENIKLYTASIDEKIEAGIVLYDNGSVIHTQYMAATDTARNVGALDLVISQIIDVYKDCRTYLSFGISTENEGKDLNVGLIRQKESFGARGLVHDLYELHI